MHPLEFERPAVIRWSVTFLGLAAAVLVGYTVGTGDFLLGALLFLVGGAFGYILLVRGATWQSALLLCFLDFSFQPLGFRFGALELTTGLGLALLLAQFWQKRVDTTHPFFRTKPFLFFRTVLFIWCAYAIGRFAWNHVKPFSPGEYAFSNAIKSEIPVTAPILMMLLFSFRPRDLRVKEGFTTVVALLLLGCLLLNIVIRIIGIKEGIFVDDANAEDYGQSVLDLPVLHMSENIYYLRALGSTAALLGTTLLTSPYRGEIRLPTRLVCIALVVFGVGGAVISGGRSDVFVAIGFCALILMLRRKLAALAVFATAGIIGLCILTLLAQKIASDPSLAVVQRSLYWANLDKADSTSAEDSINSSTLWRQTLFDRAVQEWTSNHVIFWFGRETYKYTDDDRMILAADRWEAAIDVSLRRGATHNMVTDILIVYGLVGLILYAVLCVAIIRLCFGLLTDRSLPADVKDPALVCTVLSIFAVIHGVAAGNFFPHYLAWLIIILLARISASESKDPIDVPQLPTRRDPGEIAIL